MGRVIDKKKNVLEERWAAFQKSRRAQWSVIVLIFAIPIAWYLWAQHSASVEKQRKAEEEQKQADASAAEQKAQAIASITSLFHFIDIPSGKQSVALAVNSDSVPANLRDTLANELQTLLSSQFPTSVILSEVALPNFYSAGYFDRAFGGDLGFLDSAQFFQHENVLVLVQPHLAFKDTTAVAGMRSCNISLSCRTYTSTHAPGRDVPLNAVGAGFSDEASLKAATAALQQSSQLGSLLSP